MGAKIETPRILEVAHGVQAEFLNADAIAWEEIHVRIVEFEADTSRGRLPALRTI